MAERPRQVIDYGAFGQPPSPLFRDYLAGRDGALPFYAGPWDLGGVVAAAERSRAYPRGRAALAAALRRQQLERGASAAAGLAERLADARATAVVTGQQAVLFGGPLYVLYKALGALEVARRLEHETGAPAVPVFWVASDDHDFAEIRSVSALGATGEIRTFRYSPRAEPAGQPASRIVLDDTIVDLVDEVARVLPASLHRDGIVGALAESYRPGRSLAEAFARWLARLLPELVILDVADPALKALMAPVLRREIDELSPSSTLAASVGERLLAAGYHQQVPVRPGFLSLFLLDGGERRALGLQNGDLEVRGSGRRLPRADALALVAVEPELWSPGVLLRPLCQDLLLPTAAYVGGPAEIAYHAQIGPAYEHFGIPRPALLPRPSLTLVEPSQARALEAEGLDLPALQEDPEVLVSRWTREAYPEVEEAFARAREAIGEGLERVEATLGGLDPTLRAAADAARGRALHPLTVLHEKSTRALKKRDRSRAERLRRTRDALLPGGAFQERGLSLLGLVARHGTGIVSEIRERMDPWARGHQVLQI